MKIANKMDDYFYEEDTPEPAPESKKNKDKDRKNLTNKIFPEIKQIRERIHDQLMGSGRKTKELGMELLAKPEDLPFQLIGAMTYDIYRLCEIDPEEVGVSGSQAMMVLLWAYIKEYETMKKENRKHEK